MCEDAEGDGDEHTSVGGGSRTREVGAYLALTARLDASCRVFPAPSLRFFDLSANLVILCSDSIQ